MSKFDVKRLENLDNYIYNEIQTWSHDVPVIFGGYDFGSQTHVCTHRGTIIEVLTLYALGAAQALKEVEDDEKIDKIIENFSESIKYCLRSSRKDEDEDEDEDEARLTAVDLPKGVSKELKKDILRSLKKAIENADEE